LAKEPFGLPGVVPAWMEKKMRRPVALSASRMATYGSCCGQLPQPSSFTWSTPQAA
jgi:hypothetical protein